MSRSFSVAAVAILPLLGACGLITETEYVVSPEAEALASDVVASTAYTPAVQGTMTLQEAVASGMTGFVGNTDGSISEVMARVEDGVLYVSRDGGPEEVYDTQEYRNDQTNYMNGHWSNGTNRFYFSAQGNHPGSISEEVIDGRTVFVRGYNGMETESSALPTGSAVYRGHFDARNDNGSSNIHGSLGMEVDFASGAIAGSTHGSHNTSDDVSWTNNSFVGTVAGTVEGSRVGGTIFVRGNDLSGEIDFMGGVYGETGQYIAGGVGGTINTGTDDTSLGGQFYMNNGSK